MVAPRMPRVKAAAQAHLDALKAAGVDLVPARPTVPSPPRDDRPVTTVASVGPLSAPSSLFDEAVAAAVPTTPEARRQALALVSEVVSTCPKCPELYATRTNTVFGVGPLSPDVLFLGEAPGEHEDRAGEPFVGVSGQLLNRILSAMGLAREEVYLANILKCRPPMNRDPKPEECVNCRPYLEEQLELVQPKHICCLGGTAANRLLGTKHTLGKMRGHWHDYKGTPVLVTYHPAALLRNPDWKKDTWADMQTLLARMGRPVPKPAARG